MEDFHVVKSIYLFLWDPFYFLMLRKFFPIQREGKYLPNFPVSILLVTQRIKHIMNKKQFLKKAMSMSCKSVIIRPVLEESSLL